MIFFARYEASQFGSPYILPEHLLLGIVRESPQAREAIGVKSDYEIRQRVEKASTRGERFSTSVDLPLGEATKRILAYSAEEKARLNHRQLTEIHLMLGLLRENGTLAEQILQERGATLESLREAANESLDKRPADMSNMPNDMLIDLAENYARALEQSPGFEHVLLAILAHEDSLAAKILERHGITLDSLREELKKRDSKD